MSAQREWFPAAELAGLPGMPAAKRSVLMQAEAGQWRYRERTVRGGIRREYHISALPAATRAALVWQRTNVLAGGQAVGADLVAAQAVATAAQLGMADGQRATLQANLAERAAELARADGLRRAVALSSREQARMDARLAVLRAVEAYRVASGLAVTTAEHQFATQWRLGLASIPQAVRDEIGATLSAASLQRWRLALKAGGIARLAGDYGNRKGASKVSSQAVVRAFVEGMLVDRPHVRATQVMQGLRARLASQVNAGEIELPSMRSLERWMGEWREAHKEVALALANPDAWKNKYMSAFGSASEGVERLNQLWEMDSSPADVMLTDGRHAILGVIDVYSRRARLLVSKTSKTVSVCALLRATLLGWGVPEAIKTDNGSDYTSNHFERAVGGLGVAHPTCNPFSGWEKPHIERLFGTFTRDLVELLDGFIGHNVAERKAIEARKSFAERLMTRGEVVDVSMSAAELQSFCDRWVESIYQNNKHASLAGRTPFEVASAWRGEVRAIGDERVLDVLLAEAPDNNGRRTVGKKGIRFDGADFIAPELEACVGQAVQVRYDALDDDLGRLYVFGDDGFICVAECPERTGMNRREVAIKARELQKKRVQEERRRLKEAAKKVGTDDIVEEILTTRAEAAGKLARLPAPKGATVPHEAPGVAEAARAVAAATATPGTSAELLQLDGVGAAYARLQAEAAADAAGVPQGRDNELARRRQVETPQFDSRHARAQWLLQQQHTRGLGAEEREFLAAYRHDHPASYRRMDETAAELFGAAKGNDPGRSNGTGSV